METAFPWQQYPSIYEHVRANVRADKNGLLPAAWQLPDEPKPYAEARRAAGWHELAMTRLNMEPLGDPSEMLSLMTVYCEAPTDAGKLAIYDAARSKNAADVILLL